MVEQPTTPSPTPQVTEKPDFVIASLTGGISSYDDLYAKGLKSDDFTMAPPESYWQKESVQKMFANPEGVPDKNSFDQFYAGQRKAFDSIKDTESNALMITKPASWIGQQAGSGGVVKPFKTNPDPYGRSFVNGVFSKERHGLREGAIKRGVRQIDGSYVPTDQYEGQAKFAKDKNGQFLTDSEGYFHMVPVGEEERIRTTDEVYSSTSDYMGQYAMDFGKIYSAQGIKNMLWSIPRNMTNFLGSTLDSIAEVPKAISLLGGDENSSFYKALESGENWSRSIQSSGPGENDGFFSMNKLNDLVQQVFWQLGGMKAAGGTAKFLGAGQAGQAFAGRAFMTAMAGGSIAETARENGLNEQETALLTMSALPFYYWTAGLSDKVVNGLDPYFFKSAIKDKVGLLAQAIKGGSTPGAMRGAFGQGKRSFSDLVYQIGKAVPTLEAASLEGLEEVAEQGIDLTQRLIANTGNGTFEISRDKEIENFVYAGAGGAIGGAVMDKFLRMTNLKKPELGRALEEAVILDRKEGDVIAAIKEMEAIGAFGSRENDKDGKPVSDPSFSENGVFAKTWVNAIERLAAFREETGLNDIIKNNEEKAGLYRSILRSSSIGDQIAKTSRRLRELSDDQKNEKLAPDDAKALQEKILATQEYLGKMKNGELVSEFVTEGYFNFLGATGKLPNMMLKGKEFTSLTYSGDEAAKLLSESTKMFNEQLDNSDATATIDSYKRGTGITTVGQQRLKDEIALKRAEVLAQLDSNKTNIAFGESQVDLEMLNDPNIENSLDEIVPLRQAVKSALLPDEVRDTVAQLAQMLDEYKQVSGYTPVDKKQVGPFDHFLNTIEEVPIDVDADIMLKSGLIPLKEVVRGETTRQKDDKLYTSSNLVALIKQVQQRKSQLLGNNLVAKDINPFLLKTGKDELPIIPDEEIKRLDSELDKMLIEISRLYNLSEDNKNNPEASIRKAMFESMEQRISTIEFSADLFAKNGLTSLSDLLGNAVPDIHDAMREQNMAKVLNVMMNMEESVYTYAKEGSTRSDLLKLIVDEDGPLALEADFKDNKALVSSFNYMRSITGYSTVDVYNGLHKALLKANQELSDLSLEQKIVTIESVRNMLAGEYNPQYVASRLKQAVYAHYSSAVDGGPGAGKTTFIAPAIAATMNELTGGKVFVTAFEDTGSEKKLRINKQVADFIADKKAKANLLTNSSLSVVDFLKDATANKTTSLIIVDEATLFTREEMSQIHANLNALNNQRIKEGSVPMMILYTFDQYQNNKPLKSNPNVVSGIGLQIDLQIPRTERLQFSFRSQNQALKIFENFLRTYQGIQESPRELVLEYKDNAGVKIVSPENITTEAVKMIDKLKEEKLLSSAVYIHDGMASEIPEVILKSSIKVKHVLDMQGDEADYVIGSLRNPNYFNANKANQQAMYTLATRAKKMLILAVAPNQRISSVKGNPKELTPIRTSLRMPEGIADLKAALGDNLGRATQSPFRKYNTSVVVVSDSLVPEEETSDEAGNVPEASQPAAVENPIAPSADYTNLIEELYESRIKASNQNKSITGFSFYTNPHPDGYDAAIELKRNILFDQDTRDNTKFFMTVAPIGSAGYENVINHNKEKDGQWALFVEGVNNGQKSILSVMSDGVGGKTINEFAYEHKLTKPISVSVSQALIEKSFSKAPEFKMSTDKQTKNTLMNLFRSTPKGISYSRVIVFNEQFSHNGFIFSAGEAAIATSFKYNTAELNAKLASKRPEDENIKFIPLQHNDSVPFADVDAILSPYITKGEDGKYFKFPLTGDALALYDTLWQHNTQVGYSAKSNPGKRDTTKKIDKIEVLLKEIVAKADDKQYAGYITAKYLTPNAEGYLKTEYLLANYLERRKANAAGELNAEGQREYGWLKKAFTDLATYPEFNKGFRFDVRAEDYSTENPSFQFARRFTEEKNVGMYGKYLTTNVRTIDFPYLQMDRDSISSELQSMVPSEVTSVTSNTVAEAPIMLEVQPETKEAIAVPNFAYIDESTSDADMGDIFYRHYNDEKHSWYSSMVNDFRRGVWGSMFDLGENPSYRGGNINAAVQAAKSNFANLGNVPVDEDVFDASNMKAIYNAKIIGKYFDVLMKNYFPAIRGTAAGYEIKVSHIKDNGGFDRDSMSHINENMNEMVQTMLYNTPILSYSPTGWQSTGKYLNNSHIPELIREFRSEDSIPSLRKKLSKSVSPVIRSVYQNMFANKPYTLDGKIHNSISSLNSDKEVNDMLTAFVHFMKSGHSYNIAFIDVTAKSFKTPNKRFTPNNMKQVNLENIVSTARTLDIRARREEIIVNGNEVFSRTKKYNAEQATKMLQLIGINSMEIDAIKAMVAAQAAEDNAATEQKVIDELVRGVFFPVADRMVQGPQYVEGFYNNTVDDLFNVLSDLQGVSENSTVLKGDGNRVAVVRKTAPIFDIDQQIADIKKQPGSVDKHNMLLNVYGVDPEKMFTRDSIVVNKGTLDEKVKSNDNLAVDELLEIDMIWGFANTLMQTEKGNPSAALPLFVYSDSSKDIFPVVTNSKGWFRDSDAIMSDVYESRRSYYTKLEREILIAWSTITPKYNLNPARSIGELYQLLETAQLPYDLIDKEPLVQNLMYINKRGVASIKARLVQEIDFYQGDNEKNFTQAIDAKYAAFNQALKVTKDSKGVTLYDKLNDKTDKRADTFAKSFYYNWFAFSTEANRLMNGSTFQYDDKNKFKGTETNAFLETNEYINMTKRAKSRTSDRTKYVFRDEKWREKALKGEPIEGELLYEGFKLPRYVHVARARDIAQELINYSTGGVTDQKIYDGATMVTGLSRVFQRASMGGAYGTIAPPAAKNITETKDLITGVKGFVKNAEFEITPGMLRNGSDQLRMIHDKMLGSIPFSVPVNGATNALDLFNSLTSHDKIENQDVYEQMAEMMVRAGVQDEYIHELIMDSSQKTGGGQYNDLYGAERYTTVMQDLMYKGTQLDASKSPFDGLETKFGSQMPGTLAINWRADSDIMQLYGAIAAVSQSAADTLNVMKDDELADFFADKVKTSLESRGGIVYSSRIAKDKNISYDDRAVTSSLVSQINSYLTREGISYSFDGGQYVLYPSQGLIKLYEDGDGRFVLRGDLKGPATSERELAYVEPRKLGLDGVITKMSDLYIQGMTAEQVDLELQQPGWLPGEMEIVIPMEMRDKFLLGEAFDSNMPLEEISPEYFAKQLANMYAQDPKYSQDEKLLAGIERQADDMYRSFTEHRLYGIMSRIPTTGMHSGMRTKIMGFISDVENSVFIPTQLYKIQGADQDIDKGNYSTPRETYSAMVSKNMVNSKNRKAMLPLMGKIIIATENNQIPEQYAEYVNSLDIKYRVAIQRIAIENKVLTLIQKILSNPQNAVQATTPVEDTMDPWRKLRDEKLAGSRVNFSRDDYFSYAQMHELNLAGGKNLTGVFANGLKAYQLIYAASKMGGTNYLPDEDPNVLNSKWILYSGLINASVDNGNEQILGAIGIDASNASIANYLVLSGYNAEQVLEFFESNGDLMDALRAAARYDAEDPFSPKRIKNSQLKALYMRSMEFNLFARMIINKSLPNDMFDMFNYKNAIENFVKKSYTAGREGGLVLPIEFDFLRFLNDEGYAQQHMEAYEQLIVLGKNGTPVGNHHFNMLAVFNNVPHIKGYLKLFALSYQTQSKFLRVMENTNNLISQMGSLTEVTMKGDELVTNKIRLTKSLYNKVYNFMYGDAIDQFLKDNRFAEIPEPVHTAKGRAEFVRAINDQLKDLKTTYPDNGFIKRLTKYSLETDKKKLPANYVKEAVRLYDQFAMTEEAKTEVIAGFNLLPADVRTRFTIYSMITGRDKVGKGSMAEFVDYGIKKQFNNFLRDNYAPAQVSPNAVYNVIRDKEPGSQTGEFELRSMKNSELVIPYEIVEKEQPVEKSIVPDQKAASSTKIIGRAEKNILIDTLEGESDLTPIEFDTMIRNGINREVISLDDDLEYQGKEGYFTTEKVINVLRRGAKLLTGKAKIDAERVIKNYDAKHQVSDQEVENRRQVCLIAPF